MVIVGASFIGMEVAAYLSDKAASLTVIGNSDIPFKSTLGPDIGLYLKHLHMEKKVKFVMGTKPKKLLTNSEGILTRVLLENGDELDSDVLVLGIGVNPSTDYIINQEIEMDPNGYVIVDNCMKTNVDNIFAVGDIAAFPLDLPTFEGVRQVNIGHWQLANAHGKCAALNIASSKNNPLKTVPFFWTVQFGKSVRFAGCAPDGFDDIVYDGNVKDGKFVAYYMKNNIVVAVATLGRDPVAADFANLLHEGNILQRENITNEEWRDKYSIKAKA